jgi:helicase SWR1
MKPRPKLKLRVAPAAIPFVNIDQYLPRSRQYSTIREFVDNKIHVPESDGGLFDPERDDPAYTTEMATADARTLIRAEKALLPGGLLSDGLSSLHKPARQPEPPRQYAHWDHLTQQTLDFRRRLLKEHNEHRQNAKKLAVACREEWIRRQPLTEEELEAQAIRATEARYKFVMKNLQAKWDLVKAEVNRRRLAQWEAEEQIRVRKALNEAVDVSTQKLEARRAHQQDSEIPSDEESLHDESDDECADKSSDDEEDESNMSSSESDTDEDGEIDDSAGDEELTQEQLRLKYANLPEPVATEDEDEDMDDEVVEKEREDNEVNDEFDDSDESIDMDDDMGSSDEGDDSDSDEEVDEDDDDDEDMEDAGLLGFLAPSDRKSLAQTNGVTPEVNDDEAEIDEDDEVSLIPHADTEVNNSSPTPPVEHQAEPSSAEDDASDRITVKAPSPEEQRLSVAPSSDVTPLTAETKPSDIDSASSVEIQQSSRQGTQDVATPQSTHHIKTPVPFLLRGTLREYQHYGLDWLAGLYANNTNGILADEMGLGKTIQTIALLAHLACQHHVWGPHLVVVPTSVMLNWEMEFKKFLPGFKVLTYYGTQEERKRKRQGWRDDDHWNVCITSYQLVLQDQQVFKRRKWHYMILDEAHNIKNFRSQRWQSLLTFNTRARLLLTGTPLQNNLTELWSLLFFLMPSDGSNSGIDGFADLKEFSDWFRRPQEQILENGRETMDDEARAIISKLHKVLRPYLLRRLKADVEKQMPAKYEHVEYCRLSKRQRQLYDGFLSLSGTRETLAGGNYLSIINCLMQLRKVCNHPDLFETRQIVTSFAMNKSAVADFEIKELLVRKRLLKEDPMTSTSLEFLNLIPANDEGLSGPYVERSAMISAQRKLMDMREAQHERATKTRFHMNPATVQSNLAFLESASRWNRFEELQHCVYLNALRRQKKPIYGKHLVEMLDMSIQERPLTRKPINKALWSDWLLNSSPTLREMVPTLDQRSKALESTIQKFGCVTPAVVAPEMTPLSLTKKGIEVVYEAEAIAKSDAFHEARMRLSIQFPDKRLLQYDCGKLQALDKLLRRLQAGGHRALIFTQMTRVLDILEQFLNIHGHLYLRLDGATKIEQRQILTDRFNSDTRILAFILSSRSGGLGINLTGADTVIFYDLDWNPAMDKQCQDRCHRIGQTRDVHIYRLISEHTIEANILRKANQKRMLDDVVIQEGEFTTDHFNKVSSANIVDVSDNLLDGDAAANAAMDRVLGGPANSGALEQAEDREDAAAAKIAAREITQTDAADFDERLGTHNVTPRETGPGTPMDEAGTPFSAFERTTTLEVAESGLAAPTDQMDVDEEDEINAWGEKIQSVDEFMLKTTFVDLKDVPLELPRDKNRNRKGKDGRDRSHRPRRR